MDIKTMALHAIEFLASSEGDPNEKQIGNIYAIAHAVLGDCEGKHDDWIELTKRVFAEGALHGHHPRSEKEHEAIKRSIALLEKGSFAKAVAELEKRKAESETTGGRATTIGDSAEILRNEEQ